jgi:hypothetical protein
VRGEGVKLKIVAKTSEHLRYQNKNFVIGDSIRIFTKGGTQQDVTIETIEVFTQVRSPRESSSPNQYMSLVTFKEGITAILFGNQVFLQ